MGGAVKLYHGPIVPDRRANVNTIVKEDFAMTTATMKNTVTVEDIFSEYILDCYTPDDFWGMSVELWVEILPEIAWHFTDEGREFTFTESDASMLKTSIDNMFAAKFGKEA